MAIPESQGIAINLIHLGGLRADLVNDDENTVG